MTIARSGWCCARASRRGSPTRPGRWTSPPRRCAAIRTRRPPRRRSARSTRCFSRAARHPRPRRTRRPPRSSSIAATSTARRCGSSARWGLPAPTAGAPGSGSARCFARLTAGRTRERRSPTPSTRRPTLGRARAACWSERACGAMPAMPTRREPASPRRRVSVPTPRCARPPGGRTRRWRRGAARPAPPGGPTSAPPTPEAGAATRRCYAPGSSGWSRAARTWRSRAGSVRPRRGLGSGHRGRSAVPAPRAPSSRSRGFRATASTPPWRGTPWGSGAGRERSRSTPARASRPALRSSSRRSC